MSGDQHNQADPPTSGIILRSAARRAAAEARRGPVVSGDQHNQADLITADDLDAGLCTIDGGDHDWQPYRYEKFGRPHTSMRCVWCHVIMCGDYGETDGCVEPYHHHVDHRTAAGETWPLGGDRGEVSS